MAERLGHVLYWAGCVLAILVIAIGVLFSWGETEKIAWEMRVIASVIAVLFWLIGRACRYVLAGT
jgi:uncharacterized BrkB/YihY/UPF0761 family membrane protein